MYFYFLEKIKFIRYNILIKIRKVQNRIERKYYGIYKNTG